MPRTLTVPAGDAPSQYGVALPTACSFAVLLERLYAEKFRGAITLHFDNGIPKVVEFPQPQRVTLT